MAHAVIREFEKLTPAWLELEARTRVKLRTIDNERHYRAFDTRTSMMRTLQSGISISFS